MATSSTGRTVEEISGVIDITPPPDIDIEEAPDLPSSRKRLEKMGPRDAEMSAQPRSITGFGRNLKDDTARVAEEFGEMILHPVQTIKGVGSLLDPRFLKTGKASEGQKALIDYAKGYGSLEGIGNRLYETPAHAAQDASALLGIGGGLLSKTATTGSRLSRVGSALSKTARYTDPVTLGAQIPLGIAKVTAKGAKVAAGAGIGAATGRGRVPEIMMERNLTPRFKEVLREKAGSPQEVVETFQDMMRRVGEKQAAKYQEKMAAIADVPVDITPAKEAIDGVLDRHRLRRVSRQPAPAPSIYDLNPTATQTKVVPKGEIAPMSSAEIAAVEEAIRLVEDVPASLKTIDADSLKQHLGKLLGVSKEADDLIYALERQVRDVLDNNVLGYKEMTKEYAATQRLKKKAYDELSLSSSSQEGTAVRKFMNTFTANDDYRQTVMEMIAEAGEYDILQDAAAISMRSWFPTGIMRPLTVAKIIFQGPTGPGGWMALPGTLLTSPRLTAEALYAVNALRRGTARLGITSPRSPGAMVYRPFQIAGGVDEDREPMNPPLDLSGPLGQKKTTLDLSRLSPPPD